MKYVLNKSYLFNLSNSINIIIIKFVKKNQTTQLLLLLILLSHIHDKKIFNCRLSLVSIYVCIYITKSYPN